MLPSVLVSQLQQGVEDFLRTTFPSTTPHFHGMMDRFFAREGSVFKGPYAKVQLPFIHSGDGPDYFPEVPLKFPPYAHQAKAFQRLSGADKQSTLVATGTGSGKTEAFLWPILDHVRQVKASPGIKAILIYPMNALAGDQAERIAKAIHAIEALQGVRAGLYVGDTPQDAAMTMGADHVITNRESMRLDPPDILMTNYKMLDYLLTRPADRPLWAQNSPDTLQFLVVDELHTFDGAQGTDLACLIRRLKDRLGTPEGSLCCIGTSATLGGPDDFVKLRAYAEEVFNEPFSEGAVVGEERQDMDAFLRPVEHRRLPDQGELAHLRPDHYPTPERYIASQLPLWFEDTQLDIRSEEGQIALGRLLRGHVMLHRLLDVTDGSAQPVSELLDKLSPRLPGLAKHTPANQRLILDSFLALLSWARSSVAIRGGGEATTPFLYVREQLWLRELRRMVASVGDEPDLVFSDDLSEKQSQEHLPIVRCLECGGMGWVGIRHHNEQRFRPGLKELYRAYFNSDPSFSFAFPVSADETVEADGWRHQLCGYDLHISDQDVASCESCGRDDRLVPVFVPNNRKTTKQNRQVGTTNCPHCSAPSSLAIVGSRAASLTSVLISQLFASGQNDDKRLLTFSDSVQDAAHRAGFFGARTFGFNLRSAIQQYVEHHLATHEEPLRLDAVAERLSDHYIDKMGPETFVATFIAPDMQWFTSYERLREKGELDPGSTLLADVRRRLSWEVWSAYGFRARIGRTLEKTSSSVATLRAGRLARAVDELTPRLQNEVGDLRQITDEDVAVFVRGLVAHLKNQGGIFHPELQKYIAQGGNAYVISGKHKPYMPYFSQRMRLPAFFSKRGSNRFDPVLAAQSSTGQSWLQAWAIKCFGAYDTMLESVMGQLYDATLPTLVSCELLGKRDGRNDTVWGVEPAALHISADVAQVRCNRCGHNASVAATAKQTWKGAPCLRYKCTGRYGEQDMASNYYRQLYRKGDIERIVAREHTGLLGREKREALEKAFKDRSQPWEPNLISCTPTLEMGVNIGALSTVILCSVPPSSSNFVQRIGRGGRQSGNAVDVTVANGQPHDLYFFEDPRAMIAGAIDPPGVFLGAVAVLFRQFVAYCFDRWVASGVPREAVPGKLKDVLRSVDDPATFPGPLLKFIDDRKQALFDDFVGLFGDGISDQRVQALSDEVAKDGGVRYRIVNGLQGIKRRRDDLHHRTRRLYRTIRDLEQKPTNDKMNEHIAELQRERTALQKMHARLGDTDTYNFFTDSGFLPNYAFPETGVTLRSVLYRTGQESAVWDEEYDRPARRAIKDLAPGATFYGDGRRVVVDQLNLSGDDTVEQWRLCPRCDYMERVVEQEQPSGSCPHCGSPNWSDRGQERLLVRHTEVAATTSDQRSRIDDSSEGRERAFFDTRLYVSIDRGDIQKAYRIDDEDVPFGFEFVRQATIREINFGTQGNQVLLEAAGEEIKGQGFTTCPSCGRVSIDREPIRHTGSCKRATSSDEDDEGQLLFLYRELRSECIRILLPETSFSGTPERVQSLKAAIELGLEQVFEGSVAHLETEVQEVPGDRDIARRRHLILYDTVPGGTGYLAEILRQEDRFMEVLAAALQVLERCPCNEDDSKDGCYQCLYAYRNAYDMPYTSRDTAVEVLQQILKKRDQLIPIDSVSSISVNSVIESELEGRFIQRLRDLPIQPSHLEEALVRGRPGYKLRIGDHTYEIEPQVSVGPAEGVLRSSSIDFVVRPVSADLKPIAVFLDGLQFHRNRVGRDMAQRRALLASGSYYVWSLTWQDVATGEDNKRPARNYLQKADSLFRTLLGKMGEERTQSAIRVVTGDSFDWLLQLLQEPDVSLWQHTALAQAMLTIRLNRDRETWLRSADRLLPADLSEVMGAAASREGAVCGMVDKGPDGSDDPVTLWATTTADHVNGLSNDAERCLRGMTLALHLDTSSDQVPDNFEAAWNGFLRLYNLSQFLPEAYPVTSDRSDFAAYHELIGSAPPVEPDSPSASRLTGEAWDEAWDEAFENALPETEEILATLREMEVPPPHMPYGLTNDGTIVAQAELGWPDQRVAILLPEESAYRPKFEGAGWSTYMLPDAQTSIDEVVDALRAHEQA